MQLPGQTSLAEIAFVIVGIQFLTRALLLIATFISLNLQIDSAGFPLIDFLPVGLYLLIGSLLLAARRVLARTLFGDGEAASALENPVGDLQSFAIALMGIWIVASGVLEAIVVEVATYSNGVGDLESLLRRPPRTRLVSREAWLARLPYLLQIGIGVALFVRSGDLVAIWRDLRTAGQKR